MRRTSSELERLLRARLVKSTWANANIYEYRYISAIILLRNSCLIVS